MHLPPHARSAPATATAARARVLYIQPAPAIGGAERQASVLLPRLAPYGFEVTAIAGPGRHVHAWLSESGLEARWSQHFPDGSPLTPLGFAGMVRSGSRLVAELDALHRERPFDLVVGSLGYGWVLSSVFARRHRLPCIWRAGGLSLGRNNSLLSPEALGLRAFGALWRPDALWCNAHAVARFWRPLVPVPVKVVENGVVLPIPRRRRPRASEFVLGFAGRLAPEKDVPLLVRAAALVRSAGIPVRVRIAGPGGRAGIEALARLLGIEEAVELCGPVADMTRFYESCDAFVLPSRSEGSPNVLLEAMAHGIPVIATRVGGTPELVWNGLEGFLVPPGDVDALADAVGTLVRAPGLREAMAARARRRAEQFSAERAAGGLARLFDEVLARRGRLRFTERVRLPLLATLTGSRSH